MTFYVWGQQNPGLGGRTPDTKYVTTTLTLPWPFVLHRIDGTLSYSVLDNSRVGVLRDTLVWLQAPGVPTQVDGVSLTVKSPSPGFNQAANSLGLAQWNVKTFGESLLLPVHHEYPGGLLIPQGVIQCVWDCQAWRTSGQSWNPQDAQNAELQIVLQYEVAQ